MAASQTLRRLLTPLLLVTIIAAIWFATATETGRRLTRRPHEMGESARVWVAQHPVAAPLIFIGLYIICGLLLLPIWWIQILAGYGLGLVWGCVYMLLAAGIAATIALVFSRWLGGEWLRCRIEARLDRVRQIENLLGHNGLLLVMTLRLLPIVPFGISNYLLGFTPVRVRDIFLGSILGGFPALTLYVTAGADYRLFGFWQYWVMFIGISLLLLTPLAIVYFRRRRFGGTNAIIDAP